jgi:hypothetical protein
LTLFDDKLVLIAALFAALVLIKFLAGGKPWDRPIRRERRFGHRGSLSPLRRPEDPLVSPPERLPDPEQEFFGDHSGGNDRIR